MPTPTHFDSAYNAGDQVYCFLKNDAKKVTITAVNFRVGFNPAFFVPGTDFIYTINELLDDGVTFQTVAQDFCFATKNDMATYVNALP